MGGPRHPGIHCGRGLWQGVQCSLARDRGKIVSVCDGSIQVEGARAAAGKVCCLHIYNDGALTGSCEGVSLPASVAYPTCH
jgi:hypothetical protein